MKKTLIALLTAAAAWGATPAEQKIASAQAQAFGAKLVHQRVDAIAATGEGYRVTLSDGSTVSARFLVLS